MPIVESLLRLMRLDWRVPHFSTLCRRQKSLVVDIASRRSSEPLHLLTDSTGIKVEGEGEWHARKHGGSSRRVWRKIHLAIDERTLEVCAVEVTSSTVGDAPMLPELLDQIGAVAQIGGEGDSSGESRVIAGADEQAGTRTIQDYELAGL